MAWGLHDSVEMERQGRPAVTVITQAFETAAAMRAGVLGMAEHPMVVVDHPLASRTPAEVETMVDAAVGRIAAALSGEA